jgi:hypothetical protein
MPRGGKRPGAGRKPGAKSKNTVAREIAREAAKAAAKAVLPDFQGNALTLFQQVYRDPTNDLKVRIDAAAKAIACELPRPEFSAPAGDVVPLHERLRAYARARLIQDSEGKVVDTGPSQKERVGLQPVHPHRQDLDEKRKRPRV